MYELTEVRKSFRKGGATVQALDSAPLTCLARLAEVETVADGSAALTVEATVDTCEALPTETKTVVTLPPIPASFWAVRSGT